jgi:predicted TPR repeat methyltransferase
MSEPVPAPETTAHSPGDARPVAGAATGSAAAQDQDMTLPEVLQLAQQLQRSERHAEAEAIYLQVLEQLPDEPNTLNFFGVLRHQQGRHDEALALLERAIRRDPEQPSAWLNLANVLIERGYHDDAIKALNNVSALDPQAVMPHNNLGILHTRRGEFDLAEQALKRALAINPEIGYVHYNLASLYFRTGRMQECAAHNLRALAVRQEKSPKARKLLSRALYMLGDRERAVDNLRAWMVEEPGNPEPAHYLAAMGAAEVPGRASDAYVSTVFDRFAESFEQQLEILGYRAPALVADELARLRDRLPAAPVVLDAGCGTGLCGPLLRPMAARLEGVDLSAGMLRRAQQRGDYDALVQAELTAFLEAHPDSYDAVVSADVLIYFGELDPLFAAISRALHTGGVLVATVEALTTEPDGRDYLLEVHGRYAHREAYLRAVLLRHGLVLDTLVLEVLRSELAQPVEGWLFSALKAG